MTMVVVLVSALSGLLTASPRGQKEELWPRSEDCCSSLLVSSPSLASREQPGRLGVYSSVGVMNQRRVYQHQTGRAWLYYYDWGPGHGANWMFGDGAGSEDRGLESVNLQARALPAQWCPEDVNVSKVILSLSLWFSRLC